MTDTPLLTAGTNYIYHMEAERLLRMLPDASIDLIVTSPPYDNLRTYKGFTWDFEYIARQSYRVLKQGGVMVWVVGDSTTDGDESLTSFEQALYFKKQVGFKAWDTMIWNKNTPGVFGKRYEQSFEYMFVFCKGDEPNAFNPLYQPTKYPGAKKKPTKRQGKGSHIQNSSRLVVAKDMKLLQNVWNIHTGNGSTTTDGTKGHPAMFPEKLAERHILTWSNPGDVVIDFFMGSGTTAKMARNNGRKYIGCDISAEYVALANERLAKPFTLPMFAA